MLTVHCDNESWLDPMHGWRLDLLAQVKKGNKPYTDDLAQLRNNPEDFQSEEEAANSASEAGSEGSGSGCLQRSYILLLSWEAYGSLKMR